MEVGVGLASQVGEGQAGYHPGAEATEKSEQNKQFMIQRNQNKLTIHDMYMYIVHVGYLMICDGWYIIFNPTSCVLSISKP